MNSNVRGAFDYGQLMQEISSSSLCKLEEKLHGLSNLDQSWNLKTDVEEEGQFFSHSFSRY